MIDQLRAGPARREIPFDFDVPLYPVPFSQPIQERGLLFGRECLDLVLNVHDIHVRMISQFCDGALRDGEPIRSYYPSNL